MMCNFNFENQYESLQNDKGDRIQEQSMCFAHPNWSPYIGKTTWLTRLSQKYV